MFQSIADWTAEQLARSSTTRATGTTRRPARATLDGTDTTRHGTEAHRGKPEMGEDSEKKEKENKNSPKGSIIRGWGKIAYQ